MFPKIEDLLEMRTIEGSRIEYKKGWNPVKILHTICAFANDIENIGGGYIVIGVEEKDGGPQLPPVGIDKGQIDSINKELLNLSYLIDPVYIPSTEHAVVNGKDLLVIEAIVGPSRPYRCPDSISKDKKDRAGSSYYIRKLSSTIKAGKDDEMRLFDVSNHRPFDCRVNPSATIADLRPSLLYEYLGKIGSESASETMDRPKKTLCNSLKILGDPPNDDMPINAGLLFFNEAPERFFESARIELTIMPDPAGDGMIEYEFKGPLDIQIDRAIGFIRSNVIACMTLKHDDTPVADRICNYPLRAVEEAVVNAVYHKDYTSPEPTRITVRPDRIVIQNVPGPDRSISDADISGFNMASTRYRNVRIGDLLKYRGLAEKRCTGIPNMVRSMRGNGSPDPILETDAERSFFRVTLMINPVFVRKRGQMCVDMQDISDIGLENRILALLQANPSLSMREILTALGYSRNASNVYAAVRAMISEGTAEYTIPDKIKSGNQRIRLRNPEK